jgi:hypothetical protein
MNTTSIKLRILTFPKGQSSGCSVHIADVRAKVVFSVEQMSAYGGCMATEIVSREVPVVNLQGRRFICERANFTNDVDYQVYIPQDLAATIKTSICPCCNELIPSTVITREMIASDTRRVYSFRHRRLWIHNNVAYGSLDALYRGISFLDNEARNIYIEEADEYTTARFLLNEVERGAIKVVN